jgi:hypothetical protein
MGQNSLYQPVSKLSCGSVKRHTDRLLDIDTHSVSLAQLLLLMRRHPDLGQRPTLVGKEFGQKHIGGGSLVLRLILRLICLTIDFYYDLLRC